MRDHLSERLIHCGKRLTQRRRGRCGCLQLHLLKARAQDAGVGFGDKQRPAAALGREDVPMPAGQFVEHAFADQAAEVIAHLARGVGDRCATQQVPDEGPQRAIGDPIGERAHRAQGGEQRHDARIAHAQARGALPLMDGGQHQLLEAVGRQRAVLCGQKMYRESFLWEPRCREIDCPARCNLATASTPEQSFRRSAIRQRPRRSASPEGDF